MGKAMEMQEVGHVDEDFKLTPKKIYKEVWACRNFEISNLWQRSIFLGAFMLAIATGYGVLASKMLFPDSADDKTIYRYVETEDEISKIFLQPSYLIKQHGDASWEAHAAAVGLCHLGIVFSFLWVMMAKGSKMWYERYESAICYFTEQASCLDKDMPYYGNLPQLESHKKSPSPFSPLAYYYSVSKINVTIGIVCLYVWGMLDVIHFALFLKQGEFAWSFVTRCLISVTQCFCFSSVSFIVLYLLCKSGKDAR